MLVAIGSKDPVNVGTVERVLSSYDHFNRAIFYPIEVPSGVKEEPLGRNEIYLGAENRAKNAFEGLRDSRYGVGIESGLDNIPGQGVFAINRTLCVIWDGREFYFGEGSSFQVPNNVAEMVRHDGITLDEALFRLDITKDERIGYNEGFISILTSGRVKRQDLIEQAVQMAAIKLMNKDLFRQP